MKNRIIKACGQVVSLLDVKSCLVASLGNIPGGAIISDFVTLLSSVSLHQSLIKLQISLSNLVSNNPTTIRTHYCLHLTQSETIQTMNIIVSNCVTLTIICQGVRGKERISFHPCAMISTHPLTDVISILQLIFYWELQNTILCQPCVNNICDTHLIHWHFLSSRELSGPKLTPYWDWTMITIAGATL